MSTCGRAGSMLSFAATIGPDTIGSFRSSTSTSGLSESMQPNRRVSVGGDDHLVLAVGQLLAHRILHATIVIDDQDQRPPHLLSPHAAGCRSEHA